LEQVDAYQWTVPLPATADAAAEGQVATVALSVVDKLIRSGSSRQRISSELERAGLRMRPQEWILLRVSAAIAAIAGLTLTTGSLLAGVLVGTAVAWLATMLLLKVKAARRCAAFADQLPDVLQLIASSLRSGFTLAQALEAVVGEGEQPAAEELTRALTEARLGLPLEQALDHVATRMKSQDLEWVVMAVRISRDVGGNLAEVLLTTVHTMRERGKLRRQVRALSAEGRLSGYILVALPIVVAAWFELVRPEYLRPLYTEATGIMMLTVAVLGVVVGSLWMSRIVKVEI
jgi:tight adherence protein B